MQTQACVCEDEHMSWMDVFLSIVIMAGLAVGYIQGLWRQAMSLGSILAGVILATYLQVFLTAWFGFIHPETPLVVRETVAFLLLVAIISGVLDFLSRRMFPETKLAVLGILDRVGGIFVGFFTICIQASIAVLIFKFLVTPRVSWPMGQSVRLFIDGGIEASALVPIFHSLLVIIVGVVGGLLPEGAPRFLTII
jgi:uncharacterized membrane protein required for colicin V production